MKIMKIMKIMRIMKITRKHENQGDHYYNNNKLNKIIHTLCR